LAKARLNAVSAGAPHREHHEFSTVHQEAAESPNPLIASIIFTNAASASRYA